MELTNPEVPKIIPMCNGSSPSPPYSIGVEYMRGKRAKLLMSMKVRKIWLSKVIKMGRVNMMFNPGFLAASGYFVSPKSVDISEEAMGRLDEDSDVP